MTFVSPVLTGPSDTHARARQHERAVAEAAAAYAALPPDQPVRLAKRTSNLFRTRAAATGPGLDLSALQGVVEVDAVARTARVGGLTTYEQLVDELLPHGFVPLVVPAPIVKHVRNHRRHAGTGPWRGALWR